MVITKIYFHILKCNSLSKSFARNDMFNFYYYMGWTFTFT